MSARPFRLLHITDPHLHAHPDARLRGVATDPAFAAVIDAARRSARTADAALATGDLVQDETREGYQRFRELAGRLGVPVGCLPGNHDHPAIMAEVLSSPPFRFCGSAEHGPWCLVLLDSFAAGDDGGRLGPAELARLDRCLATHRDRHVLVALHHHPVPLGSHWLDGVALRNPGEFFAVLDRHANVRAVAWGHAHQAFDGERRGVRLLGTPSTCAQFLPGSDSFALDDRPPGYRWIDLHADGTIGTEVVWLE